MKKWCNVIRGCGTGILSVVMLFSMGCSRSNDAWDDTGDALEDAGDATRDAADDAGDAVQDAAGEVNDEL